MKFSIKDFFKKCDQICRKLRIWSHLMKKFLIKNFIFLCSDPQVNSRANKKYQYGYLDITVTLNQLFIRGSYQRKQSSGKKLCSL